MKINLDQPLVDLDGNPINTDKPGEFWTLKKAAVAALSQPLDDDKTLSADKAVTRWKLAVRLHDGGEQELTPEEATEIRNRLPKCYAIVIAGQACEMLKG